LNQPVLITEGRTKKPKFPKKTSSRGRRPGDEQSFFEKVCLLLQTPIDCAAVLNELAIITPEATVERCVPKITVFRQKRATEQARVLSFDAKPSAVRRNG
jgi:hypothetical protein